RWRMKRAWTERECRLQRKPRGMLKPLRVVLEGGAFLVLAQTRPEASREVRDAIEVHKDQDFLVHQSPSAGFGLRGVRMRLGRCSSSSCSPTGSFLGSARSAK